MGFGAKGAEGGLKPRTLNRGINMAKTNIGVVCVHILVLLLLGPACEPVTMRPAQTAQIAEPAVIVAEERPKAAFVVEAPRAPHAAPDLYPDEPPADVPEEAVPVDEPTEAPESVTVVHYAELRGRIETHAGKRLTIEPLVVTTSTLPEPGCLAQLWIEAKQPDGSTDWQHYAQIKLATALEFGVPMDVDVVDDDGETLENAALPVLPRGSRVRVQWAW